MSTTEESFDVDSGAEDGASTDGSDIDSGKKSGTRRAAKAASVATTTSAKILEIKLENVERACQEYRENAKKASIQYMAVENQLRQTEKDTIDVITFLKKEDMEKEEKLEKLQSELYEVSQKWQQERAELEADFTAQVTALRHELEGRCDEVERMRRELDTLKEFQQGRNQMLKELEQIREAFIDAKEQHKKTIYKMENRILLEKTKLQQAANQKITEVASKAYDEALQSLEGNVASTYTENTKLMRALQYHAREQATVTDTINSLSKEKDELRKQITTKDRILRKNLHELAKIRADYHNIDNENRELKLKLSHAESDVRRLECILEEVQCSCKVSVERMKEEVSKKEGEVRILQERICDLEAGGSQVHRFILEAIDQVRREGNKGYTTTREMKARPSEHRVYWSDLTCQQRESVLQILFSKLNANNKKE